MVLHRTVPLYCIALAACGPDASGTIDTEDGEVAYEYDAGDGVASAVIETPEGVATMRSGAHVPVDLPGGFTLFPGAKVVSNTSFSQNDSKGGLVVLETSAAPDELASFYRKQAEAAGVKIELEMSVNGGQMIGGQSNDGMTFSLNVNREDGISKAQLMVGEEFGG